MSLITLSTVKEFLRISHTKQDTILQIIIDASEQKIADYLGVLFSSDVTATLIEIVNSDGSQYLFPRHVPILSVTKIEDVLDPDTPEELEEELWEVTINYIYREDLGLFDPGIQRYKITYKAGYSAATIPASVKLAVLHLAYREYTLRGGTLSAEDGPTFQPLEESDIYASIAPFKLRTGTWS